MTEAARGEQEPPKTVARRREIDRHLAMLIINREGIDNGYWWEGQRQHTKDAIAIGAAVTLRPSTPDELRGMIDAYADEAQGYYDSPGQVAARANGIIATQNEIAQNAAPPEKRPTFQSLMRRLKSIDEQDEHAREMAGRTITQIHVVTAKDRYKDSDADVDGRRVRALDFLEEVMNSATSGDLWERPIDPKPRTEATPQQSTEPDKPADDNPRIPDGLRTEAESTDQLLANMKDLLGEE